MQKTQIITWLGDCHELLKNIADNSIDAIVCDPPYGTMATISNSNSGGFKNCDYTWDIGLNWELIFTELLRICKLNSNILLFSQDRLTIELMKQPHNNIVYCHRLIWDKGKAANFLNSTAAPLNETEDILIFRKKYDTTDSLVRQYSKKILDYTKKTSKDIERDLGNRTAEHFLRWNSTQHSLPSETCYNKLIELYKINEMDGFLNFDELKKIGITKHSTFNIPQNENFVSNIIRGRNTANYKMHPTEKPTGLLERLIKIYTNEGDTVLDFTMGSGSTGLACKLLSRNFIGIEKREDYFNIAKTRIETGDLFCN